MRGSRARSLRASRGPVWLGVSPALVIVCTIASAFSIAGCGSESESASWSFETPDVCEFGRRPAERPATSPVQRFSPPNDVIRLVDREPSIEGEPAEAAAPLLEFDASSLDAWLQEDGLYRSPNLGGEIASASDIVIEVAARGVAELVAVPFTTSTLGEDHDRKHRFIRVPLENSEGSNISVVRIDLARLLRHSWGDNSRSLALRQLEIDVRGEDTEGVVRRVALYGPESRFPERVAEIDAERGGVVVPSWYVRSGASAHFELDVPTDGGTLLWSEASTSRSGVAEVRVRSGDTRRTLWADLAARDWQTRRVSLDEWAGRHISLSFGNPGTGVVFFGDPQLLPRTPQSVPDVVVYMIDTLAATRLGAWGSPLADRGISPTIDRLAREGATFGHAISPAPWTKPSVASFLTGLEPSVHGVGATSYSEQLPADAPTLQERFTQAGFRTGSFVSNTLASSMSGLDHGFSYAATPQHWSGRLGPLEHPSSGQLHEAALSWLDAAPDRPHFLYIHTLEVHEFRNSMFATGEPGLEPYDRAIRAQDRALGDFIVELEKRERDFVLVVVSDHGESFGDHGVSSHGFTLFEPQIHVPLIFWAPGHLESQTSNAAVSTNSVAPTLLEWFGLPGLPDSRGHSLLAFEGAPSKSSPIVPAIASREWFLWDEGSPAWYAVVHPEGDKAIAVGSHRAVFRLKDDPCEGQGLRSASSPAADALASWLGEREKRRSDFVARYGASSDSQLSADDVDRLRVLGYIE